MKFLRKNKFIFWNLVALIFVKAIFSYSGFQFASIISGIPVFTKEEVISQTNVFREFLGIGDLKESSVLDQAASQKLQDMVNEQYFAHTSPSGISPWYWFDASNYNYVYAGENLAIGFLTAQDTVSAWENSPSHRENLANPNYKEIGVAVAPAKIQNNDGFLVVQLFGTPAPSKTTAVAKPKTSPQAKPSPSGTPLVYSPTPIVSAQPAGIAEGEETPVSLSTPSATSGTSKVSKTLNSMLILYSLIIFLGSLVLLTFVGVKKELVVRTAASFALVILAVALPVLQISHTALIL